jgi:hypothetical protein
VSTVASAASQGALGGTAADQAAMHVMQYLTQ